MSDQAPAPTGSKMDRLVALCKRRGFIFQSSEIYGGINGFWDYGPLGVELKRNLKEAWWHDIVRAPDIGPNNDFLEMVGLDATIIMNPKVWIASGHVGGFNDPMVDCKNCKQRFRSDQVFVCVLWEDENFKKMVQGWSAGVEELKELAAEVEASHRARDIKTFESLRADFGMRSKLAQFHIVKPDYTKSVVASGIAEAMVLSEPSNREKKRLHWEPKDANSVVPLAEYPKMLTPPPCPNCGEIGTLTEPRQFNLMFESHAGAVQDDSSKVYLRPETAQGIFANFRNVVDTSRVKVPFGIAQIGKAFRNEVTPRNYTFRSREFEQMEIEFFIRPDTAHEWYKFWRDSRFKWWQSIGLTSANLQLREHDKDELAHYAKEGAGTSDIEYKFPFTDPGFGELEGIAHRTDFDLKQHAQHSGLGDKLKYFDQELQVKLMAEGMPKEEIDKRCKYFPHVIEPSAGADRGTLALLCEAYTDDPARPSGVVMKFHPRMAPIKAAILPLVDKDGMPEIAETIYRDLRNTWNVQIDVKQSIGKRYARMDEAGTPFCFTIDSQTLQDQTVTVRHRDTLQQERINIAQVRSYLADKIK